VSDPWAAAAVVVAQTAGAVFVAFRLSSRILAPGTDPIERWFVGLLVGVLQVLMVLQLLGALDLLTWLDVLVTELGLTVVVAWLVPPVDPPARPGRFTSSPAGALTAGAGVLVGVLALLLSLHGSSLESDTVQYHAVDAGWWLQVHNIWSLPPVDPGYFTNAYPSNGELIGLWLMLPLHSDGLVYATNVVFGTLCVLAASVAARALGRAPWTGAVTALALVASPLSFQTQTNSLMTDVTASAGLLAGAALLLRSRADPTQLRWPVLAGLALGFAVGSKDTGLLPALALVLMGVWLAGRGRRTRVLAAFVLAGAVPSVVWFGRDWVELGNPIFPEPVRVFGHVVFAGARSPLTRYATSLFEHLVHLDGHPLSEWAHLAGQLIGPDLAIAAAGVVLGAAVGISQGRRDLVGLVSVAILAWLFYSITPYTGGGPAGLSLLISSQLRYALPALFFSALLASAVLPEVWTGLLCGVALAYDAAKIVQGPGFRPDLNVTTWMALVAVLSGAAAAAGAHLHRLRASSGSPALPLERRGPPWWRRSPAATASAALGAGVLVVGGVISALPPPLEAPAELTALQHSSNPHGAVALAGVADVRSLLGPRFGIRVVSVGAGRDHDLPQPGPRALEATLSALGVSVVTVGPLLHVFAPSPSSRPGAWVPPGWRLVATGGGVDYYDRPR
jgi:hypothetical protein